MPGPTGVTTAAPVPPQNPPPATIGVIAENIVTGTLPDWEVKEFIEPDEDATSPGAFEVQDGFTSGWLPADPGPGHHRFDDHLLSTGAIKFDAMAQDGTTYQCVFTQTFRKKAKGVDESERLAASGFTITHTVAWRNNRWEYYSEKVGAQVHVTTPGAGSVRHPAVGWARVPV